MTKNNEDLEPRDDLGDRKIGAIWEGLTQKGAPKLSLVINETRYFALKKLKKNERQPDWVVFSQ